MAAEVKALRDRSRDEYEAYLLDVEAQMLAISQALNDTDLRDRPLSVQAETIRQEVALARQVSDLTEKLGSKKANTEDQLATLQALIRQQNEKIADLQSQLSAVVVDAAPAVTPTDIVPAEVLPSVIPAAVSHNVASPNTSTAAVSTDSTEVNAADEAVESDSQAVQAATN
ncbi:ATPase [Photobacterium aphoticum]|uniref:ATPase n=1 Tax=Photobacterium aphoticum TaxID=754436 RepID=A0A090QS65_9GAMM|nr:ATPase [Photobacterium aphoticum]